MSCFAVRVAEAAGLTKGAVYPRFDSKADLFLAFEEERNEQTLEWMSDDIALALEQLLNHSKIDERLIDSAFAALTRQPQRDSRP